MVNPERTQQITDAALKLFATRGYYGTGMEDIAREVGLGTSSLYNHVRGKQSILQKIMKESMQETLDSYARTLDGVEGASSQLWTSMFFHVLQHAENTLAVTVVNSEMGALEEPVRTEVANMRQEYVRRWVKVVESGNASGEFYVKDPQIFVYALIDMGIGIPLWFKPDGRFSAEDLARMYADFALAMVNGPQQTGDAIPYYSRTSL